MEPKTALQKKLVALSEKLPPITEKQKSHAFSSCLESYVAKSRKTFYCLECGHSWTENEAGILMLNIVKGYSCPSCQRTLKYAEDMKLIFRDSAYFSIITTKGGMQVIRMFFVAKDMKKGRPSESWISEVMQHWIDESGKVTTLSKNTQGLSRYYDVWILESNLEVRTKSYKSTLRYDIGAYQTYPGRNILPVIRRNGFKGNFHGFRPWNLFSLILKSNAAEILLKSNQIAMLQHYENSTHMNENWPSIRICIRNGYVIKDPTMWEDYISLLRFFGKDIRSPKYVCPANLKKEHDRLVKKKRDLDRKKKVEEMRVQLEAEQVKYAKQKTKFFGMVFRAGNISVKTIDTVEEIMIEGDKLNHCVFSNSYHQKNESLLLSARVNNEPIETIEFSLKELKVIQSRGSHNSHSKYHKQILEIVNSNISQIAQRI